MFQQLATGAAVGAACAVRRCQNLIWLSPPSFNGLGKMSKEKLRSCSNLTGTPHVAVPYVFVELRLWVVVVRLPLLVVYEVLGRTWASSVHHCWWRYGKRMNWDAMFSNWIYISSYRMEKHQPRIKRTVLFANVSSSHSCGNLGSSGPKLHRLVIYLFLGLSTEQPCHKLIFVSEIVWVVVLCHAH
jgi:hypothetical protein